MLVKIKINNSALSCQGKYCFFSYIFAEFRALQLVTEEDGSSTPVGCIDLHIFRGKIAGPYRGFTLPLVQVNADVDLPLLQRR